MSHLNVTTGRRLGYRFAITFLLASSFGSLVGCQKIDLQKPASSSAQDKYSSFKADFETAGYERALLQTLNDTAQIYWQPNWDAGFEKVNTTGTTYTYIPLTPQVRAKESTRVYYTMKEVAGRRFLLLQKQDQKSIFSLAIYTGTPPSGKPLLLNAPGRISSFRTFSGSLFIRGLSTSKNALLQYAQGTRMEVSPATKSAAGSSSGMKTQEYYNCRTTYVCDYYAYCGPDDWYNGRTATVLSDDGCQEPGYEPCYNWGRAWQLDRTSSYETCDYRDDPPLPDPDNPNPGGTGDSGTTSIQENADYLHYNPQALLGPCPGLNDSWLRQLNFKPSASVMQKLGNLSPRGMSLGGVPVSWAYYVQSIGNASGTLINLDSHAVFLNELPGINGRQTDVVSFGEYLRLHLTDLTGTTFIPSSNTGANENYLWQNSPVGAVLQIGITGDPGSVICSDYNILYDVNGTPRELNWTFTTIHDPNVGDHPVSGTRTFTLQYLGNGYLFSTQGADRLTGLSDQIVGWLTDIKGSSANGIQFTQGDAVWERLIGSVGKLATDKGIGAVPLTPVANRPKYEYIHNALQNGRSLSTIPCN